MLCQLVAVDDGGVAEEIGTACADMVQLDKDGTASEVIEVEAVCCPGGG